VAAFLEAGLSFTNEITFIVGENGSGKSTIMEALAEACGLDARGGRAGRKYGNNREKTPLGENMRLDLTAQGSRVLRGSRLKRKGFFLRAETALGFMEFVSGMPGYWPENISEMSHGEGFLTVFSRMFREPGIYLMDEPESALSFTSCLQLVKLMNDLGNSGAQVICATHSPILAATPNAGIIEVGDHGIRHSTWERLELVDHWKRYLENPSIYLRRVLDQQTRSI
jgi:predicted ATPase